MANKLIVTGWVNKEPQSPGGTLKKVITIFDDSGNILYDWHFEDTNSATGYYPTPYAIKGTADGTLYVSICDPAQLSYAYYGPMSGEFRVYNRDGSRKTTTIHHNGALIRQIEFDGSGNVIVSGQAVNDAGTLFYYPTQTDMTGYYTARKFDSAGTEIWKINTEASASGTSVGGRFAIDGNGDIVFAIAGLFDAENTAKKRLRKYSGTDGSLIWQKDIVYGVNWWQRVNFTTVAIDGSDNIYAVGDAADGSDPDESFIHKFDTDGNYIATSEKVSGIDQSFHFGTDGYLWAVGSYSIKINTSLTVIESKQLSQTVAARDSNGYLSCGNGWEIRYYPGGYVNYMDGYSWSESFWQGSGVAIGYQPSCTCVHVIENPQMPALKMSLGLAIPTIIGDRYTAVLGLPMPFALRAPTWLREFAGAYPPATIYRLYLTGGTGTIELPLSSFSCRRGNGQLTLSAVCPALTLSQLTAIEARTAGDVIVKSGPKFADGTEQLEEMLRAPFSSLRWDSGSGSASGTIEAKATALAANPKTRTLRGISYRNAINGLRRVRCAVDIYLSPGDTADLGAGETLIVSEISYQVSPEQAVMEVAEDGT